MSSSRRAAARPDASACIHAAVRAGARIGARSRFAILGAAISASCLAAPALSAQTVVTGFTANPGCGPGATSQCATPFAPTGAALAARDAFFAGLTGTVATESFERFDRFSTDLTLDFGPLGTTRLDGPGLAYQGTAPFPAGPVQAYDTPFGAGYFAADGVGYGVPFAKTAAFAMALPQRLSAFGFYAMDVADNGGGLSLEFFDGPASLGVFEVAATGTGDFFDPSLNGGLRYYGVRFDADRFDRVLFRLEDAVGGNADVVAFDAFTIASSVAVPEPGAALLCAGGLLGLALVRTRRRLTRG